MSNMAINTNILALNSHRSLKGVGAKQEKASTRLSSGYRINSAADDAAGLAISEKMRAQIRGLDMASKNSQDAISLIQTAEGGMQEVDNMLQRIRELLVQASNDTNDQDNTDVTTKAQGDRSKIQDEINQLVDEIDSMANRVEFNKKKLISGAFDSSSTPIQTITGGASGNTEAQAAQALLTAVEGLTVGSNAGTDESNLGAKLVQAIADKDAAAIVAEYNTIIDDGYDPTDSANSANTDLNALLTSLESIVSTYENTPAEAEAPANSLYFQVGANTNQKLSLNIGSVDAKKLGLINATGEKTIDVVKATGSEITNYIDNLDTALTYVTSERSKLGAAQNRLEYTIKSLDISSENLTASESRIRDTDMAKEMMNFTQANVLQQAATSMLAQANQSKQGILQLLQ